MSKSLAAAIVHEVNMQSDGVCVCVPVQSGMAGRARACAELSKLKCKSYSEFICVLMFLRAKRCWGDRTSYCVVASSTDGQKQDNT